MERVGAELNYFVRWEILTYLALANFLSMYCFYLPSALYSEGAVSLVTPQFSDLALIGSFLGFIVGMAARPLGAIFFGLQGDCCGTKEALLKSGYLLALVTLLIAFVPPYEFLGAGTPILNIILRLLQGFAIGGTYSSIALLAYDAAPDAAKGRFTCFIQVAAPAGYLSSLAAVLVTKIFLGDMYFESWGWRICFIAAFPLLYFIRKIHQTDCEFALKPLFSSKREVWNSVWNSFRTHKTFAKTFFLYVLPITGIVGLTTFTGTVYQLFFLQTLLKIDPALSKFILAINSLLYLPTFFFWGILSDRVNKAKLILGGIVLSTGAMVPFYLIMEFVGESLKEQGTLMGPYTWLMILFGAILSAITIVAYSPLISFLGEILPRSYRNFLMANAYHFGFGLLGSVSQFLGTYVTTEGHYLFGSIYSTTLFSITGVIVILIYYNKVKPHIVAE